MMVVEGVGKKLVIVACKVQEKNIKELLLVSGKDYGEKA